MPLDLFFELLVRVRALRRDLSRGFKLDYPCPAEIADGRGACLLRDAGTLESGVRTAVTDCDPGQQCMVERVPQGHIDDLVMKVAVIIQDQLFDQLDKRPVGIDLPAESAEHGKIVDGFFKIIRVVPDVKGAELLQEGRGWNGNGANLYLI